MEALQVAAGLIVRDDLILVCQRAFDGAHPGKFEFPGGKLETGETAAECLRRELFEELAVEVEVGELIWHSEHQYPGARPVALSFFAILSVEGEIDNRVFTSLRWVSLGISAASICSKVTASWSAGW